MSEDRFAPKGAIWVCAACGKTNTDQYGMKGTGSRGWDESCMLNSVLCYDKQHLDQKGQLAWWPFDQPLPPHVRAPGVSP